MHSIADMLQIIEIMWDMIKDLWPITVPLAIVALVGGYTVRRSIWTIACLVLLALALYFGLVPAAYFAGLMSKDPTGTAYMMMGAVMFFPLMFLEVIGIPWLVGLLARKVDVPVLQKNK